MDAFEESFAYCHHRVGATLQVAVAVDGSKVSKKALDLAVALANEKRHPDDATLERVWRTMDALGWRSRGPVLGVHVRRGDTCLP